MTQTPRSVRSYGRTAVRNMALAGILDPRNGADRDGDGGSPPALVGAEYEDNREDMTRATEHRRKRFADKEHKAADKTANCSGFRDREASSIPVSRSNASAANCCQGTGVAKVLAPSSSW